MTFYLEKKNDEEKVKQIFENANGMGIVHKWIIEEK